MRTIVVFSALALVACSDPGKRKIGATCDDSGQCESGLCLVGVCLDPEGDADNDSIINRIEGTLGSDPTSIDTDDDDIPDRDELDANQDLVDSDGDGKPDILESIKVDGDDDCLVDQLDPREGTADTDLSVMVPLVCRLQGVCDTDRASLGVMCPDSGGARCIYDGAAGYADPEVRCDGVDENCDGQVDEAFAGGCAVSVRAVAPSLSAGGASVASARYRARLTVGPPTSGAVSGNKYRAVIGTTPR